MNPVEPLETRVKEFFEAVKKEEVAKDERGKQLVNYFAIQFHEKGYRLSALRFDGVFGPVSAVIASDPSTKQIVVCYRDVSQREFRACDDALQKGELTPEEAVAYLNGR